MTKKINHPAAKPSGYDQMKDSLIYMFHPRGRADGVFTKNQIITRHTTYGLPEMILFVGALLALMGGLNFYSAHTSKNSNLSASVSPSVIERKLSIENALRNGRKTYQYDSRFIPGIGTISDPGAYLKDLEDKAKQTQ